jgi:mono/diheme cytochrome c family protein
MLRSIRCAFVVALVALSITTSAVPARAADVEKGQQLARQWCANCHAVDSKSDGTVQQGPPTFLAIAHGGMSTDQLTGFLSHPHGAMPDLSLTRVEISDVIAYIETLR